MNQRPTLREVASKAGVSLTTASLVMNGKGAISDDVRTLVREAAAALGYHKSSGPFLRQNEKKRAGILVHTDNRWAYLWHFIQPALEAIDRILRRSGYLTIMLPVYHDDNPREVIEAVRRSGCSSLFSMYYGSTEVFSYLEQRNIPVVTAFNNDFQDRFFSVCVDDFAGSYEGTLHLIERGHRNILYFEFDIPVLPLVVSDRYIGFQKAMNERGLEAGSDRRIRVDISNFDEIFERVRRWFGKERPARARPTAIFAMDDYLAAYLHTALGKLGLKVPRDVSIIAPGDVLDYRHPFTPMISTMRINTSLIGKTAAEMMIERLENNPGEIQVLKIKQQLVERGSCRSLA
ncbi:MAG: LacI family transcriptional regulator [Spirochaetales bacterium]|nr:LacI family transcriptional regulator [Spirochaetales bacterium]MCF7937417.1 LacI family transcriptional regulator [Spirochaetales bacterium]